MKKLNLFLKAKINKQTKKIPTKHKKKKLFCSTTAQHIPIANAIVELTRVTSKLTEENLNLQEKTVQRK